MGSVLSEIDDSLVVTLFGQFSIINSRAEDITPRGKKPGAVIALCASGPNMKRSRRWIEQTLWSDRGIEQAKGSLRQTLFDLRRGLGAYSEVLRSDRASVWLDVTKVQVIPPETGRAFLEGFDAPDPQFRDWLARRRLKHGRPGVVDPLVSGMVRIQCGLPWTAKEAEPLTARIVNDRVGGIISGFIAQSTRSVLHADADLIVRTSIEEAGKKLMLAVQVVDARRDELIHTEHCIVDNVVQLLEDSVEFGRFCWQVADTALEQLAQLRRSSDAAAMRAAWSQDAVRAVLTFDHKVMPKSLHILDEATELIDDGLFHALRAWAQMSLIMEGRFEETTETISSIRALLDRASKASPGDPVVNSLVANVSAILLADFERASSHAVLALKSQPNNIFAVQAKSLALFHIGAYEEAYLLSRQNRDVAEPTKYGAMCNLHHALLCLRTRRSEEAVLVSRAAVEAVPSYRAPSRQLVALYAASGKLEKAKAQASLLKSVEPDFTTEKLLMDEAYPANTLREVGVINRAKRHLGDFEPD